MKSIALKQWEAAAYAAGRLTQLRRVVKSEPAFSFRYMVAAPYGVPGDRLALREMFSYYERGSFKTPNGIWYWADGEVPGSDWSIPKSSTQMPLWAVRWHPIITAVRLEHVQDMSEADARACGITHPFSLVTTYPSQFDRDNPRTPWDSNPWTWVINVERVKG